MNLLNHLRPFITIDFDIHLSLPNHWKLKFLYYVSKITVFETDKLQLNYITNLMIKMINCKKLTKFVFNYIINAICGY